MVTKREKLIELFQKVEHEGGWEMMVSYGTPPNIKDFPELEKAWNNLLEAFSELYSEADDLKAEHEIDWEELES